MTTRSSMMRWMIVWGGLSLVWMGFAQVGAAQQISERAQVEQYRGVYVLPSGVRLTVDVLDGQLAVRPAGVAIPTAQQEALDVFNAKAILDGLVVKDTAPLSAALRPQRHDRALSDITRLFDLFTQEYGAIKSYQVLGSASREGQRRWTLVHVSFEKEDEVLRFVWKNGTLATIQRGAYDAAFGVPRPPKVRFNAASRRSEVTFNMRADGTVESMTVAGLHGSVTAYKVDDIMTLN